MGKILIGNIKGPEGPEGPIGPQGIPGPQGPSGIIDSNSSINFDEYKTRQNLESGDSIAVLMGKTQKHFADMSDSAYLPVVNNLETTKEGEGVLDAYQGNVLKKEIDDVNDSLKRKLLWENPNPNEAFGEQTIALSSDDYDALLIFYKYSASNNYCLSTIILKGNSTYFTFPIVFSSGYALCTRTMTRVDDKKYILTNAVTYNSSTGNVQNNQNCIPFKIYGIKL